ncbi:hypothetical protein ABZ694_24770 [Streptomyces albidoflavus]|uniref:hypothetical protein n=1 Tax=Streptomyces albidoflavus TaxID=1886 RepID=UPI0034012C71
MSGETAAIGIGFLAAGPIGAIVGGATLPALVAASMWRARRREHDQDSNSNQNASTNPAGPSRDRDRSGGGRGRNNGTDGSRHNSPNGPGGGHKPSKDTKNHTDTPGKNRKPKAKDPVLNKLDKIGKNLNGKLKNNRDKNRRPDHDKTGKDNGANNGKAPQGPKGPKRRKDHSANYPDDRRWRGRGHKDKPKNQRNDKRTNRGDTLSTTSPDGLDPKDPKDGGTPVDDRIALIKARRERHQRRRAIKAGKKAADRAARDGSLGDPASVKLQVIREENQKIDLELRNENQLLALAAATERRRSTPVNYPAITTAPAGTRTAGAAVARQIDPRSSAAYTLLAAMADQLAHGLHNDEDADMADHVVELVGIPSMCRNLAVAVREAAAALSKTAPLHPSVVKHLNSAAVAALTAARMADTIMIVFVQAHREDIMRVLDPRVGEERWNIRNAAGTLDAAKLRAAVASAHTARLALPAGTSPAGATNKGSGNLVPVSDAQTKKLITLMKGFDRGHMTVCLSEVAGSAAGVEVVADAITKLYRRMSRTWPTEQAVDETVRATASKVMSVADELRKAIKAAQRAHERELRLNAKPRKGARAEKKWDVTTSRKG